MSVDSLTPEVAEQLGLSGRQGVVVTDVEAESMAAKAGLEAGDLIMKVGNVIVAKPQEFIAAVKAAGDKGALLLVRSKEGSRFIALRN